jgi:hypothetical protein
MGLSLMQIIQDLQILFTEPEGNTLQILPTTISSKYITSYTLAQAYKQDKRTVNLHKDKNKIKLLLGYMHRCKAHTFLTLDI